MRATLLLLSVTHAVTHMCALYPAEDAAVLGWHVQQQGLTAEALRAFEAERIPRVKEVFGLTAKHAAQMKAGAQCLCTHVR